jgi:glycosyltransferase involved in cell wall biosynthesis
LDENQDIYANQFVSCTSMQISIVVPLFNEDESLPELCAWVDRVCKSHNYSYEMIMVDDGSTDNSWNVVQELRAANPSIKGIKFQRNYGKSAALNEAFKITKGDVVITMDADLQDSPDEIPELYNMIVNDGFDLVSGWKQKRYDPLSKTIPTKLFNWTNRKLSGVSLHDMNCGLKAYKSKVVKSIELFGDMHRYIPVLAKGAGFHNIGEKVVQHQARKYGVSKYMGWSRFVNGILDLFTVNFITRFGKKPMHFFGLIGVLLFFIGFCLAAYMAIAKICFDDYYLSNKPSFMVSLVIMILGTQFFLAGFVGELITRNSPERNNYLVEKVLE